MKLRIRQILALYFASGWVPAIVCLSIIGSLCLVELIPWLPAILSNALFPCFLVSLAGIILAAIWNLLQKRWAKGLLNVAMVPVCGTVAFFSFAFFMFAAMTFGPDEDHFADNLTIPADLAVAEPQEELEARPGSADDVFQTKLCNALKKPDSGDVSISANISSLAQLQKEKPEILRRYLATSPAWRLFKENEAVFATRRWMIGLEWCYTRSGSYTRHDVDTWSESGIPDFQSNFTIGLSGKPWARGGRDTTYAKAGDTVKMVLGQGNAMHESRLLITSGSLVVEVFEQSQARERRLTKAALDHLDEELQPLAKSPTWETIRKCLPANSIKHGKPSLELRNSFQPGLYDSIIWVNAGEPGRIYLKAFEATKGTALSGDRLGGDSSEWVGWSNDSEESFFSNTHFMIYEGDWGKPYAARFEVWFVPDSGGPERKLIEKVFKIEGWQR